MRTSKQEAFAALENATGPMPAYGPITMTRKPEGGVTYAFESFIGGDEHVLATLTVLLSCLGRTDD